ncbi:AAA family ATPase [Bradyrhizobium hipponense]|uniref:AAA family ATPase n=1 Tax=Bradyrhizobium hipponense TaxID=2605638 RepID=A0A5S4YN52_9BRAD|nr:TniB family NTP-binding protein [Bradyrhizobium hipponense]TYO61769.1 AAA family ATPase [Bradyrhizobium hipponense]
MSNMKRKRSLKEEMHSIFVAHPMFEEILDEISFYIEEYEPEGRAPAPCLPVVGPTGVGKSTLFEKLQRLYPRVPNARKVVLPDGAEYVCDYVPVVCITIPEKISIKDVAGAILKELGDPLWNRGSTAERTERIDRFLKYCETRALVFDESQRVMDRTGVITSQEFIDWIKGRHGMGRAAYFFFGLRRTADLFSQDSQFDRRWLSELEMMPYSWGKDDDEDLSSRDNFKGLLLAVAKQSPVPFHSELNCEDDDVAKRFFYASRGTAGDLKEKLLETAMTILTRRIRLHPVTPLVVDMELLSAAYKKASQRRIRAEGLFDPFSTKWDGRLPPPIQDDGYAIDKARRRRRRQRRSDRRREVDAAL